MLVGFAFQAVIAAALGVGSLSDDFQLAWAIVTFGTVTILTMVANLLVPRLHLGTTDRVAAGDAWLVPVAGLAFSLAQAGIGIALWRSPDLSLMLLTSAPASFLAGLAAVPQAVAYVQKRFVLAAVGPVANGVGLLSWCFLWRDDLGPAQLGIGLSVGYFVQAVVVSVPLLWNRPEFVRVRSMSTRAFIGVTAFTLLSKFQPVVERLLSVAIAEGAATALGFGQKVAQGLLLVASFGLALTATATLTHHLRSKDYQRLAHVLSRTLAGTVLLAGVTVAFALPLSYPVTAILFERGNFTSEDTAYVANVIVLQLPWVFAGAVSGVFTSYLYVERSYVRVIGASLIGIISTLGVTLALAQAVPAYAVALASSLASVFTLLWLANLVRTSPVASHLANEIKQMRLMLISTMVLMAVAGVSYGLCRLSFGVESLATTVITTAIAAMATLSLVAVPRLRRSLGDTLGAKI